jgi:hypothetical protein
MSAPAKERIEIKHRDTDKAVFTAEIDCLIFPVPSVGKFRAGA